MKCAKHQNKDAITFCKSCGRGVCDNCLVETSKGNFCKECFRGVSSENSADHIIDLIFNNKKSVVLIIVVIVLIILLYMIITSIATYWFAYFPYLMGCLF